MKFSDLKAFCLVANQGTLQHAAQILKLTPGAISLQLRRLEAETEIKLFQRTPNKLLLTDAGRTFLNQTQRLLQDFERGVALVRGGNTGSIVVTSGNDMAQFLAPRIAAFIRENPAVNISVLTRSSPESLDLVLEGKADFGIGKFSNLSKSVKGIRLFTSGIVALYPKGHPLSRVKRLSIEDLVPYGLIVLPQNSATRGAIEKVFLNRGLEMKKVLEAGGCSIIKEYVELRLGVGLVHEICIRGKKGSLCVSDAKHLFDQYDVVLIHRSDRPPGTVHKRFIESISRGRLT
jgi:LysR family transcriptional regulator, low CO2-responsive transcriptional regulator